jgi:hypothetical protein
MPKYLRPLGAMCLAVSLALGILFFSLGLPVSMIEVTLLSLWFIGTVAGVFWARDKGLQSILWGAAGGLVSVAVFVVFALLGPGTHWYGVLLLTGVSITGSLIVGCITNLTMSGITMSRTPA